MRVAGALVVVAAASCGGSARPVEQPVANAGVDVNDVRIITRRDYAEARRPALDVSAYLPDFHDELRWPLTGMNHPVLEPQFPVARELAIDVDWQGLCVRGVQNRTSASQKEVLAYLHGWCDVQKRDVDSACRFLVPLIGSPTRGLTAAVRQDLANILADYGDADRAEHWLSKHDIRDPGVLDLLAANYVEVGSLDDALTINRRAIDVDARATDEVRCHRLVKQIASERNGDPFLVDQLHQLATGSKAPDPTCVRLDNKLSCWRKPGTACSDYFLDEGIPIKAIHVLEAYYQWPDKGSAQDWWHIAWVASQAPALPEAAELSLTAWETSLRADPICIAERAAEANLSIDSFHLFRGTPAYEPRFAHLAKECPRPALPPGNAAPLQPASLTP